MSNIIILNLREDDAHNILKTYIFFIDKNFYLGFINI